MIQELLEKYKDSMCAESRAYRLRRMVYLELIEMFKGEKMIRGPFQRYFTLLERDRMEYYRRHYDWGFDLGCGRAIRGPVPPRTEGLQEAEREMEDAAMRFSREMFALWKLFRGLERKCRIYEAAYLTALGVDDGELN